MATSNLTLSVDIVGEFKRLTSATTGAKKNLTSLQRSASAVSNGIMSSFAKIGIGLSFVALTRELKEATQAAVEDNKSQVLLAESMRKTVGATSQQIKSVEDYISKTELSTQILDDKLRPAMAIALRSTGDMTKAQKLLNLAVDVSVGTGKDLEIVTKSIARAYDGNYTGLQKLVPGISKGADALDQLEAKFSGAAIAAANTDPYMQMQVAFNDLQERLGAVLLPALVEFSTWLTTVTPKIQQFFTDLTDPTTPMGEGWRNMTTAISSFGDNFDIATGKVEDSASVWGGFLGWIGDAIREIEKLAFLMADLGTEIGMWGKLDFAGAFNYAQGRVQRIRDFTFKQEQSKNLSNFNGTLPSSSNSSRGFTGNVTINTYNSNVTANDIVQKLNKATRANGTIGAIF
jgi:hypothetical protein